MGFLIWANLNHIFVCFSLFATVQKVLLMKIFSYQLGSNSDLGVVAETLTPKPPRLLLA